ncbi:MAG: RluA family pseudouridine synthase [Polyangiaceae bacterium]
MIRVAVRADQVGQRLDRVVMQAIDGLGRGGARRLFAEGRVFHEDGAVKRPARKGDLAREGMVLAIEAAATLDATPDAEVMLAIVYEDDAFVVIDKPAGMASAPLRPGERGTAASGLVHRYPEMAEIGFSRREPGLCHRLDEDTSGLLVAARTRVAFEAFTVALSRGEVDKRYLAVVAAGVLDEAGEMVSGLAPDPGDRRRVVVSEEPPERRSSYRVVRRGRHDLVEVAASPAYRHQVRVHLAARGAPIVGDTLYGGLEVEGLARHALHASVVVFRDLSLASALPADLEALL